MFQYVCVHVCSGEKKKHLKKEKKCQQALFFFLYVLVFLLDVSGCETPSNTCHSQPDCCFDHVTYLIPLPLGMPVSFLK